jgi:hypothetical protein
LSKSRNKKTQGKYDPWVVLWKEFCKEGHTGRPYQEFTYSLSKFYLFVGYLGDGLTENKDLNLIRSALNRHFSDHRRGYRPFKGVDVNAVIVKWRDMMEGRQRAKSKEPGLNRVPCPEAVLERVIVRGESAVGEELGWLGLLTVQAIGWLRADSLAGLERGDVCVEAARASVAIRYMKNRPEFRDNPGLLEWTHGPTGGHWRTRAIGVLRRCERMYPDWQTLLADMVHTPNAEGGSLASGIMTRKLRAVCAGVRVPKGSTISSHSWREMGAVASYKANYDVMKMTDRGFWRDPNTMYSSYIKPFLSFPFSALLAELFDDLQPGVYARG